MLSNVKRFGLVSMPRPAAGTLLPESMQLTTM